MFVFFGYGTWYLSIQVDKISCHIFTISLALSPHLCPLIKLIELENEWKLTNVMYGSSFSKLKIRLSRLFLRQIGTISRPNWMDRHWKRSQYHGLIDGQRLYDEPKRMKTVQSATSQYEL